MRTLFILVCFVAGSIFAGCSSTEEAVVDPIRVGSIWSLTGFGPEMDIPSRNAAQLAVKEINARGLLGGRQIQLVEFDAKRDSALAEQLVMGADNNIVSFVGLTDTDPAIGAGKAATTRGLPLITAGATNPKLPQIAGRSTFLAAFGDNVQAAAAAEYGYDSLAGRSVYVLYDNSTVYTTVLPGYFKTRWTELGGTIAGEASFDRGANNISQQIAEIQSSDADIIFFSALPEDIVNVVKGVRAAGIVVPIVGGDGLDVSILGDSLAAVESNNVYFTTHAFVSHSTSLGMSNFMNSYKTEFGSEPTSAFTALGYDAMKLMAHAIEEAGSTEPEAIFDAIESTTNFQGITGSISFSADNHIPRKSVTVIRMKDREYQRAAEFVPRSIPAP